MIPGITRDLTRPDELWATRYEEMRRRATADSRSIDNSYGYALLLRRGLVAWMKAWPRAVQEPPCDSGSAAGVDRLTAPSHLLQSAASLLVDMTLFLGTPTEVPHGQ